MNDERLMRILLGPVVSEKSAIVADSNRQFIFKVVPDATKMFEVEVENVQVVNMKGKRKRFGALQGKRKNWRKAYVRLKEGHDIDFTGGA